MSSVVHIITHLTAHDWAIFQKILAHVSFHHSKFDFIENTSNQTTLSKFICVFILNWSNLMMCFVKLFQVFWFSKNTHSIFLEISNCHFQTLDQTILNREKHTCLLCLVYGFLDVAINILFSTTWTTASVETYLLHGYKNSFCNFQRCWGNEKILCDVQEGSLRFFLSIVLFKTF